MQRIKYHLFCCAKLYDLPGIHDHDIVRNIIKKRELMSDKNHALDITLFHQVAHHLDYHLLARYIKCRGRLVRDQHLR